MKITLNGSEIEIGQDEDFEINEDNVEGELCRVGKLLCFYGNLAGDLKGQAVSSKALLDECSARLALSERSKALSSSQRITEGNIKESVLTSSEYKEKQKEYINAERQYNIVENLFRSQQKRADCVISLSYKQRTELGKGY